MTRVRTLSSRWVYRGRAVNLRVDDVELPTLRRTTREVVEHSDSVAIVAIDAEERVLLVRQFRHPVGREILEIPAGVVKPGEDALQCAQRELREETGYLAENIERLGGFYTSPGFCTEYLHLFLASDLKPSPLYAHDTETIELVRVPITQVPGLIASGEICDGKSIAALVMVLSR